MTVADMDCLDDACRNVAAAAAKGGWQLALAESCTGGLAAAHLTAIPGASKWFSFGIVSYANDAKTGILGISAAKLQKHGAVCEQTAAAMCKGAMAILAKSQNAKGKAKGENAAARAKGANGQNAALITVAITGIAGPDGGSDKKPVGMVCLGWQIQRNGKSEKAITETRHFPGNRENVRLQAASHALQKAASIMSGGQ